MKQVKNEVSFIDEQGGSDDLDSESPKLPVNFSEALPEKKPKKKYKTSSFHLNFMYKPILRRFR